jgi:hypothetical protein
MTWTKRTPPSTSYTGRSKPTTTWDMWDTPGLMWLEIDDTWAETLKTWAELGETNWTKRTQP